jgi:hypothetical protein
MALSAPSEVGPVRLCRDAAEGRGCEVSVVKRAFGTVRRLGFDDLGTQARYEACLCDYLRRVGDTRGERRVKLGVIRTLKTMVRLPADRYGVKGCLEDLRKTYGTSDTEIAEVTELFKSAVIKSRKSAPSTISTLDRAVSLGVGAIAKVTSEGGPK